MTFSQVLYIYGIIIVEFLFEYSVFAVLGPDICLYVSFFGVYSAILSLFRGKLFYGAYRLRYGLRRAEPCL